MSNNQEWNIKRLLEWTTDYFSKNNVESSRLCAEILLSHSMKCQRIELYTRFDHVPGDDILGEFRSMVKRCGVHEPVAYLVGYKEFFSRRFNVSSAVLIPRPETELLASHAMDFLQKDYHNDGPASCLDLCCGSGCLGITISASVEDSEVIMSDISEAALEVASGNAELHGVEERAKICHSDMFNSIADSGKRVFDLIVSNPPYISEVEFAKIEKNVSEYEPIQALKADDNGLAYYKTIVAEANSFLAEKGALMVEIGYEQGPAVSKMFEDSGYLTEVKVIKDIQGHDRVVKATKIS